MNPPSEEELMRYYEDNAEEYIRSTKDLDMSALYDQFLPHVPAGGLILDAGCGSGRDAKRFAEMGFRVEAIDACTDAIHSRGRRFTNPWILVFYRWSLS